MGRMPMNGPTGNGASSVSSHTISGRKSARDTGIYLSRSVISPSLIVYDVVGGAGETSMSDSEDVEIRCYSCGVRMGNATIRSTNEQHLSKIKFMLESRVRCRNCDRNTRQ